MDAALDRITKKELLWPRASDMEKVMETLLSELARLGFQRSDDASLLERATAVLQDALYQSDRTFTADAVFTFERVLVAIAHDDDEAEDDESSAIVFNAPADGDLAVGSWVLVDDGEATRLEPLVNFRRWMFANGFRDISTREMHLDFDEEAVKADEELALLNASLWLRSGELIVDNGATLLRVIHPPSVFDPGAIDWTTARPLDHLPGCPLPPRTANGIPW